MVCSLHPSPLLASELVLAWSGEAWRLPDPLRKSQQSRDLVLGLMLLLPPTPMCDPGQVLSPFWARPRQLSSDAVNTSSAPHMGF